ncbi:hypothetical protein [Pedobacter sp. D749]|uniref:hypothetical protein n=1 Tax=Pedobacter sp. D749 TaxID=2856523 RepID=UPI001C588ACF|nr:hypothetical protein [Pedobacter sp. D749]QXU43813.1 hypothetical protein KYH19_09595 [Pedobacter sp. D749]
MPNRAQIAFYWKDIVHLHFDYIMDWGEPSYWACNAFDGSFYIDVSDANIKAWNNHNYLQKCHIVPKALMVAANLVLLCRRCHKASPNTRDLVNFRNWIENRKKVVFEEIGEPSWKRNLRNNLI